MNFFSLSETMKIAVGEMIRPSVVNSRCRGDPCLELRHFKVWTYFHFIHSLIQLSYVLQVDDTCGGCAPGYSCQLTFTATYLHHTYKYRQCVHDSETVVPQEILQPSSERFGRSIIRVSAILIITSNEEIGNVK